MEESVSLDKTKIYTVFNAKSLEASMIKLTNKQLQSEQELRTKMHHKLSLLIVVMVIWLTKQNNKICRMALAMSTKTLPMSLI